jgi:hypothetical protein
MRLFYFGSLSNDGALLFLLVFQDPLHLFLRIRIFLSLWMNMEVGDQTDKIMIKLLKFLN